MSWDFDFDSPKRKTITPTQFIASADSSDDEDPNFIGPTQFIQNVATQHEKVEKVQERPLSPIFPTNLNFRGHQNSDSEDEDIIGPTQFLQNHIQERPVTPIRSTKSRKRNSELIPDQSMSPVYEYKRPRPSRLFSKIAQESTDDGLTQKIDSCSSTQSPPVIQREESTHISTPTSSNSSIANSQPDFTSFRETRTRRKRPKKGGLIDKLQFALSKEASNQRLDAHLPAKLRTDTGLTKSGQVLEVYKTFPKLTLKCLEHKLDPDSGERKVFNVLVDKNFQINKGCDVKIDGPWHVFLDKEIQIFSQVSKVSVISDKVQEKYELQSDIIYRPNCSFL